MGAIFERGGKMYNIFDRLLCNSLSQKNYDKMKNDILMNQLYIELVNSIIGMFEYKNVPDGFNATFLELFKLMNGYAFLVNEKEKYPVLQGSFSGRLDFYGFGDTVTCYDLGGNISKEYKASDICIAKNNLLMCPDALTIFRYVKILCECDKSLDCLVVNSRSTKVLGVPDDNIKEQVKTAIKNIMVGVPSTFVNSDIESAIDGTELVKVYDLTDVNNSDKIQYVSKYRDDILRRFYTYYGNAMAGNQKIAQQTVDEITSTDTMSMIYPNQRLKVAQEFCKDVNKKFGLSMSVDFSDSWKRNFTDIILGDKDTDIDNLGGESNE